MEKRCTIMRGIPGAGKSTWVKNNRPDGGYFSADDFHINRATGVYEFKPENAGAAHQTCLRDFTYAIMKLKLSDVVVDNTNVRVWEIAPYYRLAEAFGYNVEIVHIHAEPTVAAQRTIHGVPPERVVEMARSFEPVPARWNQRNVYPTVNLQNPVADKTGPG